MAKIIEYDLKDNLTIKDSKMVVVDGESVVQGIQHEIRSEQIEKHLIMFDAEMSKVQKGKAALVIASKKQLLK